MENLPCFAKTHKAPPANFVSAVRSINELTATATRLVFVRVYGPLDIRDDDRSIVRDKQSIRRDTSASAPSSIAE
jgi:hypothetical protein